jgi:flagellar protein FlaF
MQYASQVYAKAALDTASPRQLEASALLNAAAKLQAILEKWQGRSASLDEALLFNRRLWIVFIDAVLRDDNKLPAGVRGNVLRLGLHVMSKIFSAMTAPRPDDLQSIIQINRGLAAGLSGPRPKA